MKLILALNIGLLSFSTFASPSIVTVSIDGKVLRCGGATAPGRATDPKCVSEISSFCYKNTSNSNNVCFDKASNACRGQGASYVSCVNQTHNYCYKNTANSNNVCFDKALKSCSGDASQIQNLMEDIRVHAILLEKGISHQEQKIMSDR